MCPMNTLFRADLHCHSTFSDGSDAPAELISCAIDAGLMGLSITDHDTIAGYEEAIKYAKERNFLLLSGVEFSASYRNDPVHILGYAFHLQSPSIAALCEKHKKRREQRNSNILAKLRALGISISFDEIDPNNLKNLNFVCAKSQEVSHQPKSDSSGCLGIESMSLKGSIGRPHIARALVKRGIVDSIQAAFELYLGEGRPAYDPGIPVTIEETLAAIHEGKGKAVLAHPHLLKKSTTVRALLKMPFDGLECYYSRLNAGQEKKWIEIALEKKWLITGGSDYHGTTKPFNKLGSSWVGKETFDTLYHHYTLL